jgi:hypothetical protein
MQFSRHFRTIPAKVTRRHQSPTASDAFNSVFISQLEMCQAFSVAKILLSFASEAALVNWLRE